MLLAGLAVALWLLLLYLEVAPIALKGIADVLRPRMLNLEGAKGYYSVISAAVASIVGATGLLLGIGYYLHRLAWETDRKDREIRRSRLDEVSRKIDEIDEEVSSLIQAPAGDDGKRHASKVLRVLSSVEQLLDYAADLSTVRDKELQAFVRLYAYLERYCRDVLQKEETAAPGNREPRAIDAEEYADLIFFARRALHICANDL
jgi:hypothetical protein